MKKDKGVTLVSLVVYIVVMSIVIAVMTAIISNFYKNTTTVQGSIEEIIKFNKFNTYFLKEVKSSDNSIDSISENYILFSSGNSFSISNNTIYYNDLQICEGVDSILFEAIENEMVLEKRTIIKVDLKIGSFEKAINYKIENIY